MCLLFDKPLTLYVRRFKLKSNGHNVQAFGFNTGIMTRWIPDPGSNRFIWTPCFTSMWLRNLWRPIIVGDWKLINVIKANGKNKKWRCIQNLTLMPIVHLPANQTRISSWHTFRNLINSWHLRKIGNGESRASRERCVGGCGRDGVLSITPPNCNSSLSSWKDWIHFPPMLQSVWNLCYIYECIIMYIFWLH